MLIVLLFICGSCLGSLLCLIAERLPTYRSLLAPRSHCLSCQQSLRFYELIPIISIVIQKFQCRYCHNRIPVSYFFAEVFTGVVTVNVFIHGYSLTALYYWLLIMSGFTLALADYWFFIVEGKILYPAFMSIFLLHGYLNQPFHLLSSCLLSSLLLSAVYFFPEAIGLGDVLLVGLWSFLFDWSEMMLLLFTASTSGLLFLQLAFFLRQKIWRKIPFVPFLFFGLLVCLYLR
ncbi:prepilin peptidase [Enterococcus faecalis]